MTIPHIPGFFETAQPGIQGITHLVQTIHNPYLKQQQELLQTLTKNPELIQKVYEYYQKRLKQQNALDFNDLLLVMYSVLKEKPHVLASLQNRFHYFLI
jgi:superfamily I DNA/RNA helicase